MPPRHDKDQGLQRYKDGSWGIDCYLQGRRVERKIGSKADARNLLIQLKGKLLGGEAAVPPPTRMGPRKLRVLSEVGPQPLNTTEGKPTLASVLEVYRQHVKDDMSQRYAGKWVEVIGHLYPEQLSALSLRGWVSNELKTCKPATVSRKLDVLRAAWRDGQERQKVVPKALESPLSNYAALGVPSLNNQREKHLAPEVEKALASELDWLYIYVLFSLATSIRQGNQLDLRWENVSLERKLAMIPKTKNGERHPVLLSDLAVQVLAMQRDRFPKSEYCFPGPDSQRFDRSNLRQRYWNKACKDTKEALYKEALKEGDKTKRAILIERCSQLDDLHWHDLRHCAAGRLADAGHDLYTIMHILGHKDYRSSQRYAHLTDRARRVAIEDLSDKSYGATLFGGPVGESMESLPG